MSRQVAKRGEWKPEYPRNRFTVSSFDEDGVIRNGRDLVPYLPSDPGRRARLLYALGLKSDAPFVTRGDDDE